MKDSPPNSGATSIRAIGWSSPAAAIMPRLVSDRAADRPMMTVRRSKRSDSRLARSLKAGEMILPAFGVWRFASRGSSERIRTTSSSTLRTVRPSAMIRAASFSWASGSVRGSSARACPAVSVPAASRRWTDAGSFISRRVLETCARERPIRSASSAAPAN